MCKKHLLFELNNLDCSVLQDRGSIVYNITTKPFYKGWIKWEYTYGNIVYISHMDDGVYHYSSKITALIIP